MDLDLAQTRRQLAPADRTAEVRGDNQSMGAMGPAEVTGIDLGKPLDGLRPDVMQRESWASCCHSALASRSTKHRHAQRIVGRRVSTDD